MALSRAKKQEQLEQIREIISSNDNFVVVDFQNISAQDIMHIRRKFSQNEIDYLVAKKTLIKKALLDGSKDMNVDFIANSGALVASNDVVNLSKTITALVKDYPNLSMNYGFDLNGVFYNQEQLITLSKLPSRSEQIAQLAGLIASPLSGLARVLNSNIRQLASVLDALSKNA